MGPIEQIHFTQNHAAPFFRNGIHACDDYSVEDLADDLTAGRVKPTSDEMVLEVVFWHGQTDSLIACIACLHFLVHVMSMLLMFNNFC